MALVAIGLITVIAFSIFAINIGGNNINLFGISCEEPNTEYVHEVPTPTTNVTYTSPEPREDAGYSSEQVSTFEAQVLPTVQLLDVAINDYNSYGNATGYRLEQKRSALRDIIDNIEALQANEETINSYAGTSMTLARAKQYIEMLPQLRSELSALE